MKKRKKAKSKLATFRCGNCKLPFPLQTELRHCSICNKNFCTKCADHGYHSAHRSRGPKVTEIKSQGPQRTPGYFYTLFFTVVSSVLFMIAVIAYLLAGPPLQDIIGRLALVFFIVALAIGAHHIWTYRIKKNL